jgi:N-methylhydantoinase A/oxoprolinase/acetone carboxylase beta subunit
VAELQRDDVRTVRLLEPSPSLLARHVVPLVARARRALRADGAPPRRIRVAVSLDVRYRGQSHDLNVALTARYRAAFDAAHAARYGYADRARAVEVVNLRVTATAPATTTPTTTRTATTTTVGPGRGPVAHRVRWDGGWLAACRYDRAALPRRRVRGPLVITELSATTFVPPLWTVRVTASGDLLLESR